MDLAATNISCGQDLLWREHASRLVGFATFLVGPSDANDIVVEAFLRAAPRLVDGEVDDALPYLFRAVTNQAHDLRRGRNRRWRRDLQAVRLTSSRRLHLLRPIRSPLTTGAELYSRCATCHGGNGGGVDGQGCQFSDGEILATFPRFEDQLRFVFYGTDRYRQAGVEIYGDPNRSGGPHLTGGRGSMPPFGAELTPAEIVAVVCHERFTLGGADPGSDDFAAEYDTWCSPNAAVSAALLDGELELVDTDADRVAIDGTEVTVIPIGRGPIPGTGSE